MNSLNTASVSLAVTPTVISTLLSHYLDRGPLRQKPTAHLSYNEGLHLIRSFLEFASHHTVEELQAFTAQWVPHPQWVKVIDVTVSDEHLDQAAALLQEQLGQDGIRKVGGRKWWQWRKPNSPLAAEWIEMRADYNERKKNNDAGKRVMLYIHGGAYFFGSVDEHRYQLQRHARKLKARVFAPEYRLAPQFPFPCGLHDCLAAYLYLLSVQEPNTIVLAGDSAGGGMVVSLLVTLRDRGIPLPAGAVLISPWVDLTHSFPSVSGDNPLDYIPSTGFHHKPSRAWPPPNEDDMAMILEQAEKHKAGSEKGATTPKTLKSKQNPSMKEVDAGDDDVEKSKSDINEMSPGLVSVVVDGKTVVVKDQIQMYTTNDLLSHPLVSPVTQPTLGGLPPILIMVGGGEVLQDEQIYLAHKCANPTKYAPPEEILTEAGKAQLEQYKPTDVQLQVWDDLCHVAPTLSFTRPAKFMYRSVAQFSAWALARAQNTGIDILDDDAISVISSSGSDTDAPGSTLKRQPTEIPEPEPEGHAVGKAGDPLPPFKNHMIRQRITRHGGIFPLCGESELPACSMPACDVGLVKEESAGKWMETKKTWDTRYASVKAKIHKKMIKDMAAGYLEIGDGETPPPSALAGRRKSPDAMSERKKTKSMGLALWSLWGSKHDEMTVEREQKADTRPDMKTATADEGTGARAFPDLEGQDPAPMDRGQSRSRSRRRTVVDENQTDGDGAGGDTMVEELIRLRKEHEAENKARPSSEQVPDTGVDGKRPMVEGISVPFRLNKDADSASMFTLQSTSGPLSPVPPMNPVVNIEKPDEETEVEGHGKHAVSDGLSIPFAIKKEPDSASMITLASTVGAAARFQSPVLAVQPTDSKIDDKVAFEAGEHPQLVITAAEELADMGKKDEAQNNNTEK